MQMQFHFQDGRPKQKRHRCRNPNKIDVNSLTGEERVQIINRRNARKVRFMSKKRKQKQRPKTKINGSWIYLHFCNLSCRLVVPLLLLWRICADSFRKTPSTESHLNGLMLSNSRWVLKIKIIYRVYAHTAEQEMPLQQPVAADHTHFPDSFDFFFFTNWSSVYTSHFFRYTFLALG